MASVVRQHIVGDLNTCAFYMHLWVQGVTTPDHVCCKTGPDGLPTSRWVAVALLALAGIVSLSVLSCKLGLCPVQLSPSVGRSRAHVAPRTWRMVVFGCYSDYKCYLLLCMSYTRRVAAPVSLLA